MTFSALALIVFASLVSSASPGPATLSIMGTSMRRGRSQGMALAAGIVTMSWLWSAGAALGLSAIMAQSGWALELVRYAGVIYLLYLAVKSARSALFGHPPHGRDMGGALLRTTFAKGLLIHLTNPKAILWFGALYAIGMPAGATPFDFALVVAVLGLQSAIVFFGYAMLFSTNAAMTGYARLHRWFDGAFALFFGAASVKILTARLS